MRLSMHHILLINPRRSEGGGQSTVINNLRNNDPRQHLFRNSNAGAEKQYVRLVEVAGTLS